MKPFIYSILIAAAIPFLAGCSASGVSVPSPDGNLKLNLSVDQEKLTISIDYKGETIVTPSPIGLEFEDGSFGQGIKMSRGKQERVTEEYDMPVGKASHICDVSNQRKVSLTAPDGRKVEIILRAFDDGVAFRYLFPESDSAGKLLIKSELMEIHPAGDPVLKAMYIPMPRIPTLTLTTWRRA